MLTISQQAYERLSEILADRPADVAARIVLEQGRPRIRSSRRQPGDEVLTHNGRAVLLLDPQAARRLDERTLGIRQTADGPRLRLQRP